MPLSPGSWRQEGVGGILEPGPVNLRKEGDSGPRRIRIPGRFVFQKLLWPTQANSVLIHKREAKKKKKTLSSKGANFQSVLKRTKANLS